MSARATARATKPGLCECRGGWGGADCSECDGGACFATDGWVGLGGAANVSGVAVDASGGYAYVATWTSPSKVVALRLSDNTEVASLELMPGEERVRVLLLDAAKGYLYAGCFGRPARVVKLKVGGGKIARETAVVIPNDVGIVSGFLDDAGEYGYFGTYSNPGVVLKVGLAVAGREPRLKGRLVLSAKTETTEGEGQL